MTKADLKTSTSQPAVTAASEAVEYVYDNIFIVSNRGGMGKSTRAEYLSECVGLAGIDRFIWEVDKNNRLKMLYGDLVTNIDVPDAHVAADDDVADTVAFAPLFEALASPRESGINIVDVGANMDERVTFAIVDHAVDVDIDAAERKTSVLVVIDNQIESVAAGILSARMYMQALPNADIFIVQPSDHLSVETLFAQGAHPKLAAAYEETISPLLKKGNLLVLPRLRDTVHDAYRATNCSPVGFMRTKPERIGKLLRPQEAAGTASLIGQRMIRQFHAHFDIVKREFERKLGFRSDASSPSV